MAQQIALQTAPAFPRAGAAFFAWRQQPVGLLRRPEFADNQPLAGDGISGNSLDNDVIAFGALELA